MNFPQFTISRFGYYDSDVVNIGSFAGKYHTVLGYELDFFADNHPGGQDLNGTFYPARCNSVFLAKPGQQRAMHPPYRCWFLNIATHDLELQELFAQMPTVSTLLDMDQATALFQQMTSVEDKLSLEGRLQLLGCASQLLALLNPCRVVPEASRSITERHHKTLMAVDKYIRQHLSENLNLEVLAKEANLDPTYFHKLFTATYGMTPAKRVLSYRISAAKIGIIEGTIPLDELAAKCGFSSQSYFCYKFKKAVGISPTQYREDYLMQLKN